MKPSPTPALSRRDFLWAAALGGLALVPGAAFAATANGLSKCPIVVFSKVYQELKLDFAASAGLTAEAGLDGVDAAVRPQGEIEPERVADELPLYVEALKRRKLRMPLITSGITGIDSPHAESVVRAARKAGVQYYRLGFVYRAPNTPLAKQAAEVKSRLKDLAALNQQVGIGALLQNHSQAGRTYFGGDLRDLEEVVLGFDPARVGVAFDIGHALVVHGDAWREHFERLKSHIRIAYVKDVVRGGARANWVAFGKGEIAATGYFKLLAQTGYQAPISMHIEYDWRAGSAGKTRAGLLQALRDSAQVLRGWLAAT